jgi:hypothetical protein
MNITNEEKSVAQRMLNKCKEQETKKKLVPVKIGKGIMVMMPPNFTQKQLEAKRKKYINL